MPPLPSTDSDIRHFLLGLFEKAVASAQPEHTLADHLPSPPRGRTLLIAVGKAAASMARAAEIAWPEDAPLSGIALTRYGHGIECETIDVIEAAHPVPDNRGFEAAQNLMNDVLTLGKDDLLLFLVSGGGSALLALPAAGISIEEKKTVNKALLMSGAPIDEMNCIRKHLSAIKGGRLAEAARPARVVTLSISDVPGDDPSTIASGPTVPDPSTLNDAHNIVEKYQLDLPLSVKTHLARDTSETPKPGSDIFSNTTYKMISSPADMMAHIANETEAPSCRILSLGADVEGEACEVGRQHAELALAQAGAADLGALILSGGETTVTIPDHISGGRGGRNCEYLLSLAVALDGKPGIWAIAADTDGIDGSEDNAGAIITPDTLSQAVGMGLDANHYLEQHDAYSFFETLGDLVITGPTRTNVNDFRAIWCEPRLAT